MPSLKECLKKQDIKDSGVFVDVFEHLVSQAKNENRTITRALSIKAVKSYRDSLVTNIRSLIETQDGLKRLPKQWGKARREDRIQKRKEEKAEEKLRHETPERGKLRRKLEKQREEAAAAAADAPVVTEATKAGKLFETPVDEDVVSDTPTVVEEAVDLKLKGESTKGRPAKFKPDDLPTKQGKIFIGEEDLPGQKQLPGFSKTGEYTHWVDELSTDERNAVNTGMRGLDSDAANLLKTHEEMTPQGDGSHMDPLIWSAGMRAFTAAIKGGLSPDAAMSHAKEHVRKSVKDWNDGHDAESKRYEGMADSFLNHARVKMISLSKGDKKSDAELVDESITTRVLKGVREFANEEGVNPIDLQDVINDIHAIETAGASEQFTPEQLDARKKYSGIISALKYKESDQFLRLDEEAQENGFEDAESFKEWLLQPLATVESKQSPFMLGEGLRKLKIIEEREPTEGDQTEADDSTDFFQEMSRSGEFKTDEQAYEEAIDFLYTLEQSENIPLWMVDYMGKDAEKVSDRMAANLEDSFDKIQITGDQMTALAKAGAAKKGWYSRATKAIFLTFGSEAALFTGILAATSPHVLVKRNLLMATRFWQEWNDAKRPMDEEGIRKIANKETIKGWLPAWTNNVVRAIKAKNHADIKYSKDSPKVQSFYENLMGDLSSVTLDSWMIEVAGLDKNKFNKSQYLAYAAMVRRVAKNMGWQPAEVQETTWSFGKVIAALQVKGTTASDALAIISDAHVDLAPEFAELLNDPEIYAELERLELTEGVERYNKTVSNIQRKKRLTTQPVIEKASDPGVLKDAAARIKAGAAAGRRIAGVAELLDNLRKEKTTRSMGRTAIARDRLSKPAEWLQENDKLEGKILDYGSGMGFDAENLGAEKYDLHHYPVGPKGKYDTVYSNYMLNVIESHADRLEVIGKIQDLLKPGGKAYVSVRNDVKELRGKTKSGRSWQGRIELKGPAPKPAAKDISPSEAAAGGTFYHAGSEGSLQLSGVKAFHAGTRESAIERITRPSERGTRRAIHAVSIKPKNPYMPDGKILDERDPEDRTELFTIQNTKEGRDALTAQGHDVVPYINAIEDEGSLSYLVLTPSAVTVSEMDEQGNVSHSGEWKPDPASEKTQREREPYAFQDTNQERLIHDHSWDRGLVFRNVLEGTGDVFRELTKNRPNRNYIEEKLKRLEKQIAGERQGMHRDDTRATSREHNRDKFSKLARLWGQQPTTSEMQELAKELNLATTAGKWDQAESLVSRIRSGLEQEGSGRKEQKTKPAAAETQAEVAPEPGDGPRVVEENTGFVTYEIDANTIVSGAPAYHGVTGELLTDPDVILQQDEGPPIEDIAEAVKVVGARIYENTPKIKKKEWKEALVKLVGKSIEGRTGKKSIDQFLNDVWTSSATGRAMVDKERREASDLKKAEKAERKLLDIALRSHKRSMLKGQMIGELKQQATAQQLAEYAGKLLKKSEIHRAVKYIVNSRTPSQVKAAIAAMNNLAMKHDLKIARKDLKDAFNKASKANISPSEYAAFEALTEDLSLVKPSGKTITGAISILTSAVKDEHGAIPPSVKANAEKIIASLSKRNVSEMSLGELVTLTESIRQILHIRAKLNEIKAGDDIKKAEAIEKSMSVAAKKLHGDDYKANTDATGKPIFRVKRAVKMLIDIGGHWQHNLRGLVNIAFGKNDVANDILVKNLTEADVVAHTVQREYMKKANELFKKSGLSEDQLHEVIGVSHGIKGIVEGLIPFVKKPREKGYKVRGHDDVYLTVGELMSLSVMMKDSHIRNEYLKETQKGFVTGRGIRNKATILLDLSPAQHSQLVGHLSPKHAKLADNIQKLIHELHSEHVVPTFWEVFGERMDNMEDHFPGARYMGGKDSVAKDMLQTFHGASHKEIQNADIYQKRVGGDQPFILNGIASVLMSQVSMAATLQKAEAAWTADIMINSKGVTKALTAGMRNGAQYIDSIKFIIGEYAGMRDVAADLDQTALNTIRSNSAIFALGLSPKIWAYQWTSLIAANTKMDARWILKGVADGLSAMIGQKGLKKFTLETAAAEWETWSAKLANRRESHAVQLSSAGYAGRKLQTFYKMGKGLIDYTLEPISWMDSLTVSFIWNGKKAEGRAKGLRGDALMKWVATETEAIVDETQPTWDPLTSSQVIMRGRSSMALGLFTMFMSQPQKHANLAIQGVVNFKRSDRSAKDFGKLIHNTVFPVLGSAVAITAINEGYKLITDALFGRDDEDDPEEMMERVKRRIVGNVAGSWLVYGSAAISAKEIISSWDIDRKHRPRGALPIQAIRATGDGISSWGAYRRTKGELIASGPKAGQSVSDKHFRNAMRDTMTAMGLALGLPTSQINQVFFPYIKNAGKWKDPHLQKIEVGASLYSGHNSLLRKIDRGLKPLGMTDVEGLAKLRDETILEYHAKRAMQPLFTRYTVHMIRDKDAPEKAAKVLEMIIERAEALEKKDYLKVYGAHYIRSRGEDMYKRPVTVLRSDDEVSFKHRQKLQKNAFHRSRLFLEKIGLKPSEAIQFALRKGPPAYGTP